MEIGNIKCQIAASEYEFDRKIINYKNYVKKLKSSSSFLFLLFSSFSTKALISF